jgi:16S rRNA (uracil1498-N3)-methyltransferase
MKPAREHLRCFVAPAAWQGAVLTVDADEAHHLVNVLRARVGEQVEVFDGAGRTASAQLVATGKRDAELRLIEEKFQPRPAPELALVQALPREATMDFIVQKAVELGAAAIYPVLSERCIVRLKPDQYAEKSARWQRIALNAARQSHAAWLMYIAPVQTLENFFQTLETPGQVTRPTENFAAGCRPGLRPGAPQPQPDPTPAQPAQAGFDFWFVGSLLPHAQPLRAALAAAREQAPRRVAALIGPEGDLTPAEHRAAEAAGAAPVSFGQSVLRVDTAAFYAISAMKLILTE